MRWLKREVFVQFALQELSVFTLATLEMMKRKKTTKLTVTRPLLDRYTSNPLKHWIFWVSGTVLSVKCYPPHPLGPLILHAYHLIQSVPALHIRPAERGPAGLVQRGALRHLGRGVSYAESLPVP